jgi:septal ring factor EnvC (AmiA/AmiB activator)
MDMEKIQSEIAALKSQIQALQQERAALTNHNVTPENDSPLAIVEAYRRQARENVQLSAELKGIDDAMYFLEKQIQQRKAHLNRYLPMSIRISQQQEQLEEAKKIAQIHAERVNELALELAKEIKLLKTCADELSPMYWQVYYKPFITGFKTISVPFVRSDGEVWMIVNRIV